MSNKTSFQLVLDLINSTDNITLTADQITFGAPAANANGAITKNTQLDVTGVTGKGYSGTVRVYFDRVALSDISGGATVHQTLTTQTSSSDLLSDFNTAYNTGLTTDDIVVEALPAAAGDGTITYNLTAAAGSLAFIGAVQIVLTPADVPLSSAITTTDLNGLTVGTVTA